MMSKVFGRVNANEEVVEMLADINSQVEEQGASLIAVNTNVVEMHKVLEGFRQYIEGMEVRLHTRSEAAYNDMQKAFEQGIDSAVGIIKKEVAKIGEMSKPQEVVKAIERRSAGEKKLRAIDANMAKMQDIVAEQLVNDLPLIRERSHYAHPHLTPQGDAVYKEVSRFLTQLAKINGRNKEYYTNTAIYQRFFDRFGIKRYDRISIRMSDGRSTKTLLGAVIVNGHIKQYVNFIKSLSNAERNAIEK